MSAAPVQLGQGAPRRQRHAVWRARGLSLCLAASGWLAGVDARGAEGDSRHQAAEALFQQGKDLLDAGHLTQACAKFEASQALDEGLGTLLFLGECYEKVGRTASAWRAFSAAAERADRLGDARRGGLARIRVAALEPVLARLLVRAAPQTQALPGLELRLNGAVFNPLDLERPIAIDPGDVLLEVTAPEHERWQTRLEARPGPSNAVIDVPRLIPIGSSTPPHARWTRQPRSDTAASDTQADSALSDAASAAPAGPGFTTWALVLGAAGVAGAGAGVYLGLDAVDKAERSRERHHCPLDDRCYAAGLELREDARSQAHLADVVTGAGAALLLGGIVLYLVAPGDPGRNASKPAALSIAAGPGEAGLGLEGRF